MYDDACGTCVACSEEKWLKFKICEIHALNMKMNVKWSSRELWTGSTFAKEEKSARLRCKPDHEQERVNIIALPRKERERDRASFLLFINYYYSLLTEQYRFQLVQHI